MKAHTRHLLTLMVGVGMLVILIGLTLAAPPARASWLPGLLFCGMILTAALFSVPLAGGAVSLLPMTMTAAFLVMGLTPTCWAAQISVMLHGWIRYRWTERPPTPDRAALLRVSALTAANSIMYLGSIMSGAYCYARAGGQIPLHTFQPADLPPLIWLSGAYLAANYAGAALYIAARGRAALRAYVHSLPTLLFYEGAPLIFAPLMALIYTRLGVALFSLFALILLIATLIARSLDSTSRRLERRLQELSGLQAVGQALSASLDTETVVTAIYTEVAKLMPARNFYVALYDPELDEVSFPLAIEAEKTVRWRSRQAGNGLTEYVLRARQPLCLSGAVKTAVQTLGIEHIGKEATCWLGVPILARDTALGVIAVQSYEPTQLYDLSHQALLTTIATQAAVAIQNARLYARTDEALARRVQELDSILHTTGEGMLLLDPDYRVLAANRALTELVGSAQLELIGQTLEAGVLPGEQPLATLIGYTPADLRTHCQALAAETATRQQTIVALGPAHRHVERTLTPVRDGAGRINGWLLLLRDMTDEVELARLKHDLTNMLVHDLRSPLTAISGSLGLLKRAFARQNAAQFEQLLALAQQGSERMLRMINELLDIGQLESGQIVLHPQAVCAADLIKEAVAALTPLATLAQINFEIAVAPDLPVLTVDPQLIGRAINNLLDNAIKFTPDHGHIRLWARRDAAVGAEAVLIGITDSGPGIPPSAMPKLFQKFQQVAAVEGRRKGTGLGLAFCKLVIEAHAGKIWAESQVGQGSTFIIALPGPTPPQLSAQSSTATAWGAKPE